MVAFKNDFDTFCKYIAIRPPNVEGTVYQHLEDRHLEKAIRGLYYVAQYAHQPAEGEATTVTLDQYCGRVDPDAETDTEERATTYRIEEIDQRVEEAVAQAGAHLHREPIKYTGEIL